MSQGTSEERVEVMYNECFGGFHISEEAVNKYLKEMMVLGKTFPSEELFRISRGIDRQDKLMIQIVKELGEKSNTKFSNIALKSFPAKYAKFIEVDEYDGYETVDVNMNAYKLFEITRIVRASNTEDSWKIQQIDQILAEEKVDA